MQSQAEVEEFGDILKGFVKSNDVAYNTGSIVFTIVDNTREAWVKSLEKRLGPPVTKTTSLIFRQDNWTRPSGSEIFDKIVVTVYNTDKKGRTATVMFQGKSYVPYMTFVVPEVLKEIKAEEVRAIQVDKKELTDESTPVEHEAVGNDTEQKKTAEEIEPRNETEPVDVIATIDLANASKVSAKKKPVVRTTKRTPRKKPETSKDETSASGDVDVKALIGNTYYQPAL